MKRILNSIFLFLFITILFSCKNSINEQIPSIELKLPGVITNSRYALDNKRFTVDLIQDDEIITSDFALSGEAVCFYWVEPGFYTLKIQVFDISDIENEYLEYFGESEQFEVIAKETTDVTVTLKYVAEKETENENKDEIKEEEKKDEKNDPVNEDNNPPDNDGFVKINEFYKYEDSKNILGERIRYYCNYKISNEITEGSSIVLDIKGTSKLPDLYAQFVPTDPDNKIHDLFFQYNSYYEFPLGDDNQEWEVILPLNFVKFYTSARISDTDYIDTIPDGSTYNTIQLFFDVNKNDTYNLSDFNDSLDISMKIEIYTPEKKHLEFLRSTNYDDSTKADYPYRFYVDYVINASELESLTQNSLYKFEINGTLENTISQTTYVELLKNDGSYGDPYYPEKVKFNLKETSGSNEFELTNKDSVLMQITVPCTQEQLVKRIYIDNFDYNYVLQN